MRWIALIIAIACFAFSLSLANHEGSRLVAITAGPWAQEETTQRELDYARAQNASEAELTRLAGEANRHSLRAALNIIGWLAAGFFLLATIQRRKIARRESAQ